MGIHMKKTRFAITITTLALACLLSGCLTPSRYAPIQNYDGYDDTRLQENVFAVSFAGNDVTSQQRAQDFALLRCAEVTLANGFRYFAAADSAQTVRNEAYQTVQSMPAGYRRLRTYETSTTLTSRPQSSLTIVCYKEKPDTKSGILYDAQYLAQSIRAKYKISGF